MVFSEHRPDHRADVFHAAAFCQVRNLMEEHRLIWCAEQFLERDHRVDREGHRVGLAADVHGEFAVFLVCHLSCAPFHVVRIEPGRGEGLPGSRSVAYGRSAEKSDSGVISTVAPILSSGPISPGWNFEMKPRNGHSVAGLPSFSTIFQLCVVRLRQMATRPPLANEPAPPPALDWLS